MHRIDKPQRLLILVSLLVAVCVAHRVGCRPEEPPVSDPGNQLQLEDTFVEPGMEQQVRERNEARKRENRIEIITCVAITAAVVLFLAGTSLPLGPRRTAGRRRRR